MQGRLPGKPAGSTASDPAASGRGSRQEAVVRSGFPAGWGGVELAESRQEALEAWTWSRMHDHDARRNVELRGEVRNLAW